MGASDKLSILQVCSASEAVYGAALTLLTLAHAQRAAGHRVEFVTFAGKKFGRQIRREGFKVHEIKVRAKIDPVAILQLRKIARQGKFDLVHTHLSTSSVNGCLAARLAKVPCIATVHGMSGKLSFAAADHLLGVSEQVKNHLVKQGVPENKISVVYNGLPPHSPNLSKSTVRELVGVPREAFVVGTVSRVTALKGIEDGIRAVAKLSREITNLHYLVVGDGDGMESCKKLVSELGLEARVTFAGYRRDVHTYLEAMDMFLFPSHKEALGMAIVEALGAGLPVVATNVDGIPEVVSSDCGVLVPVSDPNALADAALELIRRPEARAAMSAAGIRRAAVLFSDTAMERSTEWVYRSVLGLEQHLPAEDVQIASQPA